jgi:hypothetical protein
MTIRRDTQPFFVDVDGESGPNKIVDIYITELGFVMISVFNEDKKVTVNYICKNIQDILPEKIKLKEFNSRAEVIHQSSQQQPSKDDKFSSSL